MRLEQRVLPPLADAFCGDREQRTNQAVELVLGGAVVGVQRDRDRVLGGDDVGELSEGHRAGDHVLDTEPGPEFSSAGRELDDAVTAGVGEALIAALMLSEPTQLIAGNANECSLARPSISA